MPAHPLPDCCLPAPTARRQRFETIVVGAGHAGLAVGHHLANAGADFVILSDEARVGDGWRRRWDSLRLFTPAAYSGLPGMPFPAPPSHLPDRDEVADYLERYAARFELPVVAGTRVERLTHDGARFVLHVGDLTYEAEQVVVATGANHRAFVPSIAARLAPSIGQLHSSQYRSPFALPGGPALVVGAGNSGAQIALELARDRKVWLAGRDTGHLPRRFLGRDLFDWIWPVLTRATTDTLLGRRLRGRMRGGDRLIGIPERALVGAGVRRVGRLDEERGGLPRCGGEVLAPSVVVWCTGFRPSFEWIALPIHDASGAPRHTRGVADDVDGLYFAGLPFQQRMASTLLGGVGHDAAYVAQRVLARTGVAA